MKAILHNQLTKIVQASRHFSIDMAVKRDVIMVRPSAVTRGIHN